MSAKFAKGTKVWPVHRDPKNTKNTWCAKPVTLNRTVTVDRDPVAVDATAGSAKKFSRFVEMNRGRDRKYKIWLFGAPVPQDNHVVMGFIALE